MSNGKDLRSRCLSAHPGHAKTPPLDPWQNLDGFSPFGKPSCTFHLAAWKRSHAIAQRLCSLKLLGKTLMGKGIFLVFTFFMIPIALWAFFPSWLFSFACNLSTFGAQANQRWPWVSLGHLEALSSSPRAGWAPPWAALPLSAPAPQILPLERGVWRGTVMTLWLISLEKQIPKAFGMYFYPKYIKKVSLDPFILALLCAFSLHSLSPLLLKKKKIETPYH